MSCKPYYKGDEYKDIDAVLKAIEADVQSNKIEISNIDQELQNNIDELDNLDNQVLVDDELTEQPQETKVGEQEAAKEEVKDGVDTVFESNPELSEIGSEEEYSEYLKTKGITQVGFHHANTDLENFSSFPEGYFPQALKKKGTHYKEADDVVFFVKKPLEKEFMSKRKFTGSWGLTVNNTLDFSGQEGGIDEGIKAAVDGGYDSVDFGEINDNKTKSEVFVILNPTDATKLGSKQDIQGFKDFTFMILFRGVLRFYFSFF